MTGLPLAALSLAGLAAKATLVLSLAFVLAWLARRGSARTLHMLWTTTFVLLLALPALSRLGPSWAVPILPVRDTGSEPSTLARSAGEVAAGRTPRDMTGWPAQSGSPREIDGSMAAPGSFIGDPHAPHSGAGAFSVPPSPAAIAFLIWALGSTAALISLAVGVLRFRKLVHRASPLGDPTWLRQTDEIRRRLGLRADVRLLSSARVPTPMTGGLRKPVILLPSSAETWSRERRTVVLAHELVHVRRQDALRQIVARVGVALYWFHPLSWLASRFATVACERSCDEEVLALGTRPSEYARHLFSLASEMTPAPAVLSLPIVNESQLENRIMSILKQHRPRFSVACTTAAMAAIGMAGILAACANPVPRDPAAQPSPPVEMTVPGDLPAENSAIRVPDPEPTPPGNPVPEPAPPATRISTLLTQLASVPDAPPATPEVSEDAGPQALECNPGIMAGVVRRDGEWTLQQRVDGMRLCMRTSGNVEMTDDGTAVQGMQAGSWLVLESQAERLHRLVITSGPGGLEHDWSIDGSSRPFDAEAGEWRDLMLTVMGGYREAQEVRGQEASLRRQMGSHERHFAGLRRQIGAEERHVTSLRRQIGSQERHFASLRRQIGSQERHFASLRRQLASADRTADRQVASLQQRMARTPPAEMREALRATTRALEQLDLREVESATQALVQEFDEVRLRELDEDVRQMVEDALKLQEEIQTEVGKQLADMQIEAVRMEDEFRSLRQALEEYDLDQRVREIEEQIEQYDLDGKIREMESQIEEYDLEGKVREIEARIEQYDLEGKISEIEARIEELDADRRADEIERSVEDEISALRRLIG